MKAAVVVAATAVGCAAPVHVAPRDQGPLTPVAVVAQDATAKEEVRMLPAEAYLRTYLDLSGGGSPLEVQERARAGGLFDSWSDYTYALGLPDHRTDIPRATQSNALMAATADRLAIALCVRAAEHDLRGKVPPGERHVFAFPGNGAPQPATAEAFAPLFDVLHRTFLGYPAALAPAGRAGSFYTLYRSTLGRTRSGPLAPPEAAWVAVCIAFARHPEFTTY